jgi:hypothetical protein
MKSDCCACPFSPTDCLSFHTHPGPARFFGLLSLHGPLILLQNTVNVAVFIFSPSLAVYIFTYPNHEDDIVYEKQDSIHIWLSAHTS